ncbi:MAG: protein-L-isoaspartate(D-aspartate) O-methyltransferase [Candidatus Protistobacter heckmanni]|nr:protein-L-isoaspartate(D-aspartate) O-methyltransferase [Candidatus Protistobacter heckmanni]
MKQMIFAGVHANQQAQKEALKQAQGKTQSNTQANTQGRPQEQGRAQTPDKGGAGAAPAAKSAAPRPVAASLSTGAPAKPAPAKPASPHAPRGLGRNSERARHALAARLAKGGVSDARVLDAMARVPRHLFVDTALDSQAYEDTQLPIGHSQTISAPSIVASMIEVLRHGLMPSVPLGKVLEIGTGCGYQAAVLAQVAREVYSIERVKPLYEKVKSNLRHVRIPNLRLHFGDGMLGLPPAAPFDAIILAAAGMAVPQALLDQLVPGGKLIAPVAKPTGQQTLQLIVKNRRGELESTELEAVFFVPLKSGTV